ncbi:MAG: response regulator [Sulfuricurvum sp.]|uniref:HD domain-containing phosphohydrolase n=1 Tax=Sulfuricurvum sp. TaxID=2025608 RepID=UPI00261B047C|nr:HD domain-containing phosphohydrolase [Sulfuricurvum sp.]MDD2368356.1 response regulator [Sulfuricurvum sp.]MDD5117817.1 response regulator [Sulfuricurvum sp.]
MAYLKELKAISSSISILYVEDDAALQKSVVDYLRLIFPQVDTASNGEEGLIAFRKKIYDIIITDIQMPHMNGLEMIKAIKEIVPEQEIIITTAFSEVPYLLDALSLHASGYLVKPIDFDDINLILFKIVDKINKYRENELYKESLEEMVRVRTEKNITLEIEKIENYEKTLLSFVELVEKRDTYTGGHSERVATYCKLIAEKMGYSTKECDLVYRAGILHDIGKIVTPDSVLLKPGKLDDLEYRLICEHVTTGSNMLQNIPMYFELSQIVAAHHERHDGTGYPLGIQGDAIPPLSRIMIVADAFDAMTTNRIYKPRMNIELAIDELKKYSGTQFNPEVTDAAITVLSGIEINTNISQLPSTEMEQKRFSFFFEDSLCKIYNPHYLDLFLVQHQNNPNTLYLKIIFIHNFNLYNNRYGWDKGDLFLKSFADILRKKSEDEVLFRLHGDDFVLLSNNPISLDLSLFTPLLQKSDNLITLELKEFNTDSYLIHSLEDLEELLK